MATAADLDDGGVAARECENRRHIQPACVRRGAHVVVGKLRTMLCRICHAHGRVLHSAQREGDRVGMRTQKRPCDFAHCRSAARDTQRRCRPRHAEACTHKRRSGAHASKYHA
eukprot:4543125-Prymnesium_polylepis.2